jgi:hypothetical protein
MSFIERMSIDLNAMNAEQLREIIEDMRIYDFCEMMNDDLSVMNADQLRDVYNSMKVYLPFGLPHDLYYCETIGEYKWVQEGRWSCNICCAYTDERITRNDVCATHDEGLQREEFIEEVLYQWIRKCDYQDYRTECDFQFIPNDIFKTQNLTAEQLEEGAGDACIQFNIWSRDWTCRYLDGSNNTHWIIFTPYGEKCRFCEEIRRDSEVMDDGEWCCEDCKDEQISTLAEEGRRFDNNDDWNDEIEDEETRMKMEDELDDNDGGTEYDSLRIQSRLYWVRNGGVETVYEVTFNSRTGQQCGLYKGRDREEELENKILIKKTYQFRTRDSIVVYLVKDDDYECDVDENEELVMWDGYEIVVPRAQIDVPVVPVVRVIPAYPPPDALVAPAYEEPPVYAAACA